MIYCGIVIVFVENGQYLGLIARNAEFKIQEAIAALTGRHAFQTTSTIRLFSTGCVSKCWQSLAASSCDTANWC